MGLGWPNSLIDDVNELFMNLNPLSHYKPYTHVDKLKVLAKTHVDVNVSDRFGLQI